MRVIRRTIGMLVGGLLLAPALGVIGALTLKNRFQRVEEPDADEVALAAILEPIGFRSEATDFRGGTVECWYGGGYIDLRSAQLDPAGATLKVRAVFGGGQIVVPEGWVVTSHVLGIGGLADNRQPATPAADAPQITIEGFVLFGGFAVVSELPEAEVRGITEALERQRRRRERSLATGPELPKAEPAV